MLIVEQPKPIAIVGIALDAALGRHVLVVEFGGAGPRRRFRSRLPTRPTRCSELTLTDDKMVNPPA